MSAKAWAFVGAYVASIAAANYLTAAFGLVSLGFGLSVTAGTFAAGAALVLRDGVQRASSNAVVLCAIAVGCALSYVLASPMLALASALAFLVSELVDFAVFTPMQTKSIAWAVVVSSVVSAPVDTVLFLHLAGFGVSWSAVLGQFIVKTFIAAVAAAWLALRS
jgi:uncharacterized PurR-regulated membrane protein YhhQ (DUF165 family)